MRNRAPHLGRRHIIFDDAVEVNPAALAAWAGGAVFEKVPGFAVLLPLVEFVPRADADRMFFAGDRERYDVPHVFRNAVNRQIVEIGRPVKSAGSPAD
jgi:hypothetical protein